MTTINPYLTFNGDGEAAFNFYQSVFGGEFPFVGRFKDMPESTGYPIADTDKEKIMHISLPIGKETTLMGGDTSEAFGELSAGGKIKMPLTDTFWSSYFGLFIDKFGIHWMVSSEHKKKGK